MLPATRRAGLDPQYVFAIGVAAGMLASVFLVLFCLGLFSLRTTRTISYLPAKTTGKEIGW
jgi:hypothetical protein